MARKLAGDRSVASGSRFNLALQFWMAMIAGRVDAVRTPARTNILRTLEHHLGHCTTPRQRRKVVSQWCEFQRRKILTAAWLKDLKFAHAERVVKIEGLHHLDEALARGTGAILGSAHFGSPRLIKPTLGLHGRPARLVGVISRAEQWPDFCAEDLPATMNLRPFFAALKRNEPLIILVDGGAAQSFATAPVLGIDVRFASGVMSMARVARVPLLPTFLVDNSTLRNPLALRLVIHPELELQITDDPAKDLIENTRRFADVYTRMIETQPHNLNWAMIKNGEFNPLNFDMPRWTSGGAR